MDIDFNLKFLSYKWKVSIRKQWVQFGIIIAIVLASIIFPYWGSSQTLLLIPLSLGGIGMVLALLKQINIGFIFILLSSMFVPFRGPGGVNATVLAVAILVSLWFIDMIIVKKRLYFIQSKILVPVSIMIVISIIAFVMGQVSWFPFAKQAPLDAQLGGFFIFLFSLSGLLATAHLLKEMKWLEIITWVFIGFGGIYIIGRLFGLPVIHLYQLGFTANSMFWTWLVALSFSQLIFNPNLKSSIKLLLLLLIAVTFYVAVVQAYDWKSGWVPPLVAVAVILGLRYPRLVIIAIPVALIVVGYVAVQLIASDEYSWGTRVDAWLIILNISRQSPLFGLGFSNYYWYTPLFSIRGWYVNFNSHSQFIDLIAQVGILGLFCFIWIFFEAGRLSLRLSQQLPDGFARSYAYGALAGVIGTLVAAFLVDWVLPFVYNIGFNGFRASILPWIFLGGLVSIEQIFFVNQNENPAGALERKRKLNKKNFSSGDALWMN